MGQLREQLVEDYAGHFARLHESFDTRAMSAATYRMHDRTFGEVLMNLCPGARILDLGCGVGTLLNWLSQKPSIVPIGVDASPTQLEFARRNLPDLEINCADGFEYLRAHPDSFDGIFCTDVLEHIPGTDLCIEWVKAARAALRSGGFFVCRGPNAANLTGTYCRYIDLTHERSFTEMSILQLLDAGGLAETRILPVRAGDISGNLRQWAERLVHHVVYRICGQGNAKVFTYNICAVGYRRDS